MTTTILKVLIPMAVLSMMLLSFGTPAFAQVRVEVNGKSLFRSKNQKAEKTSETGGESLPKPAEKSSVNPSSEPKKIIDETTNSPVGEIIYTNKEYSTFEQALPHKITEVKDGDPLWMYLRFPGPMINYIPADLSAGIDENGFEVYSFRVGMGPEDASDIWNIWPFYFQKKDLSASEIKINLAPGIAGKNKSANSFLHTVGKGRAGIWKNAMLVYVKYGEYLAVGPLTCNVENGITKYKKMSSEWFEKTNVGTAEENVLPEPQSFSDNSIRQLCLNKIRAKEIKPSKFYFTSKDWSEVFDGNNRKVARVVNAAFTYTLGNECMFGTLEIRQPYSSLTARYGESELKMQSGFPYLCK